MPSQNPPLPPRIVYFIGPSSSPKFKSRYSEVAKCFTLVTPNNRSLIKPGHELWRTDHDPSIPHSFFGYIGTVRSAENGRVQFDTTQPHRAEDSSLDSLLAGSRKLGILTQEGYRHILSLAAKYPLLLYVNGPKK
jgi:hypothetical protein